MSCGFKRPRENFVLLTDEVNMCSKQRFSCSFLITVVATFEMGSISQVSDSHVHHPPVIVRLVIELTLLSSVTTYKLYPLCKQLRRHDSLGVFYYA